MLEVALMAGVNDRTEDAKLATFVHGITAAVPAAKVMVNLIPYNPGSQSSSLFQRPSFLTVRAFQGRLWDAGSIPMSALPGATMKVLPVDNSSRRLVGKERTLLCRKHDPMERKEGVQVALLE